LTAASGLKYYQMCLAGCLNRYESGSVILPLHSSTESALAAYPERAFSVRQVAAYWRDSPRKIRALIRRGLLRAIDLGCGRQQLRVTPAALRECEERLAVKTAPPRRRRQRDSGIDPRILAELEATQ
jgi:hypothetical protein